MIRFSRPSVLEGIGSRPGRRIGHQVEPNVQPELSSYLLDGPQRRQVPPALQPGYGCYSRIAMTIPEGGSRRLCQALVGGPCSGPDQEVWLLTTSSSQALDLKSLKDYRKKVKHKGQGVRIEEAWRLTAVAVDVSHQQY